MLRTFEEMVPKIGKRSAAAVDREIAEIRKARRSGRRRTFLVSRPWARD
jgi:hypothetical protein